MAWQKWEHSVVTQRPWSRAEPCPGPLCVALKVRVYPAYSQYSQYKENQDLPGCTLPPAGPPGPGQQRPVVQCLPGATCFCSRQWIRPSKVRPLRKWLLGMAYWEVCYPRGCRSACCRPDVFCGIPWDSLCCSREKLLCCLLDGWTLNAPAASQGCLTQAIGVGPVQDPAWLTAGATKDAQTSLAWEGSGSS